MLVLAAGADAQRAIQFRVEKIPNGPKVAVWFADRQERSPLILFSHGFNGCGTQSVFFTEELARAGYVVAAPDHADAGCSLDGRWPPRFHLPNLPFTNPGRWSDATYAGRRADLEATLDWILKTAPYAQLIDPARIGAAGHSLGGYSVLGLAGGWEAWRDPRISAVVALAPYVKPYLLQDRMRIIRVPVMYQAAQFDVGITPALAGPRGAVAETGGAAYFVELKRGNHFEWTNSACWGHRAPEDCMAKRPQARLIVEYARAFFDKYLKQRPAELDALKGAGLHAYRAPSSR